MTTLAQAFRELLSALDRMEIPFLIAGSVASSNFGMPRQTNDIDILADFRNVDATTFCDQLSTSFYVDLETVIAAIRDGRSFNVIHLRAAFKFDFFPAAPEGFAQSELGRKQYIVSALPGLERIEFPVSSVEDTVLSKLAWFRKGGEMSDRQWHDILGVLSVQSTRLDYEYMRHWATGLGVLDLLDRALDALPG
ncbi:MAG: hypothetical protein HY820_42430 [Acidobacteria bacterium]|nr:hypothetical protein [Acidobacteriota bacterium]